MENVHPVPGKVYALLNPAIPYSIKIGLTEREDLARRPKELYTTGVPMPFSIFAFAEVHDSNLVETMLHKILQEYRFNKDREFFGFIPDPLDEDAVVSTIKKFKVLKNKVHEIFAMLRASNVQNQHPIVCLTPPCKSTITKGICRKCGLVCGKKQSWCFKGKGCRLSDHNNCVSCGKNSGTYMKCKSCKH